MNAPQTEADYDRIRDAELTAYLDRRYGGDEEPEEESRQSKAIEEITDALKALKAGKKISYQEIAGILIEYELEIVSALEAA